jgi:hypothetical protein
MYHPKVDIEQMVFKKFIDNIVRETEIINKKVLQQNTVSYSYLEGLGFDVEKCKTISEMFISNMRLLSTIL